MSHDNEMDFFYLASGRCADVSIFSLMLKFNIYTVYMETYMDGLGRLALLDSHVQCIKVFNYFGVKSLWQYHSQALIQYFENIT